MGYNAYDVDLGDYIDADLAVKKDKGKYLCPNEDCREKNVPVFLKEGQHGCFFSSYDIDQHCENCTFTSDTKSGENYRYKEFEEFSMEHLVENLRPPELAEGTIIKKTKPKKADQKYEDNTVVLNSIAKLYSACKYNDIKYQLTPKYKVSDICIDERTTENFRKLLGKSILFIGKTVFCNYSKKSIKLRCNGSNDSRNVIVSLYLSSDDYWSLWHSKLSKINRTGTKIRIACVASFSSRIVEYKSENNTTNQFTEYFATIGLKNIKVLDRVHHST